MKKLNVLITGADGFIGKAFARKINNEKYNVYGLDCRRVDESDRKYFKDYYLQDLTKKFKLNLSFDYVFHLAALNITHVGKASYKEYEKVNVLGTQNLIGALLTKKFIFMSTAKVYKTEGRLINEEAQTNPIADYEKSKFAAEKKCQKYLDASQLIILRPVNIVGPGQADKAILPLFFKNAIQNLPIHIFAPSKTVLQFLYIDDVLRVFKILLKKPDVRGIFNLASNEPITIQDLVKRIVRITHSKSPVNFSNTNDAVWAEVISRKAKTILGWQAHISTDKILRNIYRALKEDETE